jgi:transglutaminase-like putative cysteine protease
MTLRSDPRDLLLSLRRVEGWFTLGLIVLVCATLAWSLDDALLVLGRDQLTDFLFWAAIGGVVAGFVGPAVGWGRWTTQLIGAISAALLVPLLVGWSMVPDGAPPAQLFQATTDAVVGAWSDLVLAGEFSTPEYGHHLLVLGLIVWGSSQFASYAAFGHRRPMHAVIIIGLLLIGNMALTVRDQLVFLVIFSIASLFLLVRFHTIDEQADWLRRRIGDPSAISALYLRGGTVFIIAAIGGSLLLTTAASSAPLSGAWSEVGARFIEWGQAIERFLPPSRTGRSLGPAFGASARVGTSWSTDDAVALRLQYVATELEADIPYLTAAVYDKFELGGWTRSGDTIVSRATGAELLGGTGDQIPSGLREITATITPGRARSEVFLPGIAGRVDQPVNLRLVGRTGYLHAVEREISSEPYTVTGYVPALEKDGGRTASQLRAAGREYPPEIVALYGRDTLPAGALGPLARGLLQAIVAEAATDNPYDLAVAIRDTLLDGDQFRYDTDLTDERCEDPSIVECFVTTRAGFCQYYASTMTVFLRELGIPARFVQGWLKGEADERGGGRTIRNHDAHAWVQVYFPGHGWVEFDPTGGSVPQLAPIPSGRPVASASARPSSGGVVPPVPSRDIGDEGEGPGGSVNPRSDTSGTVGLLIAMAILLAVGVGAVAAVAWQRGPRGPVSADSAYGSIARLAARLGLAPRPNETVYEFAGALADQLPGVRPELETVARAKVEVAYGGRILSEDRLAGLRQATRRLRVNLMRLALRRGRRRRR